jgi:hypothetical protein
MLCGEDGGDEPHVGVLISLEEPPTYLEASHFGPETLLHY